MCEGNRFPKKESILLRVLKGIDSCKDRNQFDEIPEGINSSSEGVDWNVRQSIG